MSSDLAKTIYAPSNIVLEDSVETGPYPRDMVWLWFRDGASQAQRQAAVNAICGIVVGGFRYRPGGVYYVRITGDRTTAPLHAAIGKLMTFPQVMSATPDLSLSQNSSRVPPARPLEIYNYSESRLGAMRAVIKTPAEFDRLWQILRRDPSELAPTVDFSKDMLIVAGMGWEPDGGYRNRNPQRP